MFPAKFGQLEIWVKSCSTREETRFCKKYQITSATQLLWIDYIDMRKKTLSYD